MLVWFYEIGKIDVQLGAQCELECARQSGLLASRTAVPMPSLSTWMTQKRPDDTGRAKKKYYTVTECPANSFRLFNTLQLVLNINNNNNKTSRCNRICNQRKSRGINSKKNTPSEFTRANATLTLTSQEYWIDVWYWKSQAIVGKINGKNLMSAINNTTENYTVGNLSMQKLYYSVRTYYSTRCAGIYRYFSFSWVSEHIDTIYLWSHNTNRNSLHSILFSAGMVWQWNCRCRFLAISRNFCTFFMQFGNYCCH